MRWLLRHPWLGLLALTAALGVGAGTAFWIVVGPPPGWQRHTPVSPETARYFSPDYHTARARFRTKVEAAHGRLAQIPIDARGPAGEALTIDIGGSAPRGRAVCCSTPRAFTAWRASRARRYSSSSSTRCPGSMPTPPSSSSIS
jgi:hypothetical protein